VEILEHEVLLLPASPLDYLLRWRVGNRLFNDDAALVGLVTAPQALRIVISQRDVGGPYPSWPALEREFTERLGFRRLQTPSLLGGYDSRAYFRGRIGVFDVRPANCAQVGPDMVAPFNVIPQFFNRASSNVLQRLTISS
jgi:hypothetical protein